MAARPLASALAGLLSNLARNSRQILFSPRLTLYSGWVVDVFYFERPAISPDESADCQWGRVISGNLFMEGEVSMLRFLSNLTVLIGFLLIGFGFSVTPYVYSNLPEPVTVANDRYQSADTVPGPFPIPYQSMRQTDWRLVISMLVFVYFFAHGLGLVIWGEHLRVQLDQETKLDRIYDLLKRR